MLKPISISIFLALVLAGQMGIAQESSIQLKSCIDAALANKANIKAARTDLVVAGLQRDEAKGRYLPDISVLYEYRYNPIIPTQVIPSGQFLPVPTNELRPVKFGTTWAQNAGLTVYQPIIDGTIKNRMEESRINERVKQADLRIAEEELVYEVVKSYSKIMQASEQSADAALDTARTFQTLSNTRDRYEEGKLLKTELNRASLNHRNAVSTYKTAWADLLKEKFYLSYLTGIPAGDLITKPFDFSPLNAAINGKESLGPRTEAGTSPMVSASPGLWDQGLSPRENDIWLDSIASIQQLKDRQDLLAAQSRTEQRRPLPTLGFQGFLGANQFTNNFNPFESNTWFGNSYVGLQVKVPILSSENRGVKVQQFGAQQESLRHQQEDLRQQLLKDYQQSLVESARLRQQAGVAEEQVALLEENVQIYQDRVAAGKENTHELLLQEIDLQQEKMRLRKLKADLAAQWVEQMKASGRLVPYARSL